MLSKFRYYKRSEVLVEGGNRCLINKKEKLNLLHETLEDDTEYLQASSDAKIGHKTADSAFFRYKTHIAMSEERIITTATFTISKKNDGKELKILVNKTKEAGVNIETTIVESAYSEKGNIELANENNIKLVANYTVTIKSPAHKAQIDFEKSK